MLNVPKQSLSTRIFFYMIGLFNPKTDLLSLHYDHAPDKDDGHATVAGKVLADTYGLNHVAVGGAHGKNGSKYNSASELVMDATWGINGWINAHDNRQAATQELGKTWLATIQNGGQIFVAEGGQADTSLGAAQYVRDNGGDQTKIHIIQHSQWNIDNYGDGVLDTLINLGVEHLKIGDGNSLNGTADLKETNDSTASNFESEALASPWSDAWQAAFDYYDPVNSVLDFSDTVETLHILGVGLDKVDDVTDFANLYLNTTVTDPGNTKTIRIEAEDYALGGQNVSFYDTTAGNSGGAYRNDDVDIQTTSDVGGGYNVGWIDTGEWLTYDLNVPKDGQYALVARVATPTDGIRSFNVTVDNQSIPFKFDSTGGWQSWQDVVVDGLNLTAGAQQLRIDMSTDDFNLNYLDLIPVDNNIRIEAEDYASGGQNVSFYDTTAGNSGGAYRNDDVDIQTTSDVGGGYNVGWIDTGEWLTYDLNVPEDGQYALVARVANPTDGIRSFNITVDKQSIPFKFDSTGGWQSWQDVVVDGINLTAGAKKLRIDMSTGDFNLNYLDLIPADDSLTPVTVGLSLVDADQDTIIGTITEGITIDLATFGSSLSIKADPSEPVSKVEFNLTGATEINQTETLSPYALAGDSSGDYYNANFNLGDHILTVTPYDLNGQAYESFTTNFSVLDSSV
jgi:hypothetical protein